MTLPKIEFLLNNLKDIYFNGTITEIIYSNPVAFKSSRLFFEKSLYLP